MSTLPNINDRFGAYLITGEIGRGGMGVVFAAVDERLNRSVALKVLDPAYSADASFVKRFGQEGEVLARMNSPHVIQIFGHGQVDGCLYLAMQYVAGGDLASYLKGRGVLPLDIAASLAAQVASALADAHALGIVHRDIKPSNVLLTTTGNDPFVYLCDFGIARVASNTELTQAGMVTGSVAYMAPEILEGNQADERGDLYALGCLLWALIAGSPPYRGTELLVARQHQSAPVPQVVVTSDVDVAVNQLLASLMAKDPSARLASAVEAGAALRRVAAMAPSRKVQLHATGAEAVPVDESTVVRAKQLITPLGSVQQVDETRPAPPRGGPPGTDAVAATLPAPPRPSDPADATALANTLLARPGQTSDQTKAAYPHNSGVSGTKATSPRKPRRRKHTALIAVAIVVVAALGGGLGLWGASSLLSGPANAIVAASVPTTPAASGASSATEATSPSAAPPRDAAKTPAGDIRVGSGPHGVAIDATARRAYVANYNDATVSAINLDTQLVEKTITVGSQPQSLAVDPGTGILLVGCDGESEVQLFKTDGYERVGVVRVGSGLIRLAAGSDAQVAYAVAQGSTSMSIISLTTFKIVGSISVGAQPRVIGLDGAADTALVGHWAGRKVTEVSLTSKSATGELRTGLNPNGIAVAGGRRLALVANYGAGKDGGGSVTVINLDSGKVVKTIAADRGPSRVAVDEDAGVAYVTCLYASRVDVIDLDSLTITRRLKSGNRPGGVAVDSQTGRVYVASFDDDVIRVFES